ncbi:N-acetyltransferase [bacterium]|nr:N-acetyltransferase [bacterium]
MQIIDLAAEQEPLFFLCLEDWSAEARESGGRRQRWYRAMKERGLRVKLAVDGNGTVGGMIQYLPVEHSFVSGSGLYFAPCIWVHGHKQGRGDFRKRGMGSALLAAAEQDARDRGARGFAAWGLLLPFWMKAAWFRKHGYRAADRDGIASLLWKPFAPDAQPPRWTRRKRKSHGEPGKVVVASFNSGWCMAQNLAHERAKRAAAEIGGAVEFREYDTLDPAVFAEWGISDALFVDGREVRTGPPPAFEKIRSRIEKRAKSLR